MAIAAFGQSTGRSGSGIDLSEGDVAAAREPLSVAKGPRGRTSNTGWLTSPSVPTVSLSVCACDAGRAAIARSWQRRPGAPDHGGRAGCEHLAPEPISDKNRSERRGALAAQHVAEQERQTARTAASIASRR